MIFRHSTAADVPQTAALFDAARAFMRECGLDQWQRGVPGVREAERDTAAGNGRVISDEDGTLLAVYTFVPDGEPDYDEIAGAWRTAGENYAAIHRVTITREKRGSGLSGVMMDKIKEEARARGFASVRIDTHPQNVRMRHMLEHNGFAYCGEIRLHGGPDDGALRAAYEFVL